MGSVAGLFIVIMIMVDECFGGISAYVFMKMNYNFPIRQHLPGFAAQSREGPKISDKDYSKMVLISFLVLV